MPAVSGNPDFERVFRVQMNTLEWMPIFLPSLWLFAIYISDPGRGRDRPGLDRRPRLYLIGYSQAAEKRGRGFAIQAFAAIGSGSARWARSSGGWSGGHHARPSPGRGAACNTAPLNRDPIWSRPMEKCGSRLCWEQRIFTAGSASGTRGALTSSAGSRFPWGRRTPCRRAPSRTACSNPRASSIPTAS